MKPLQRTRAECEGEWQGNIFVRTPMLTAPEVIRRLRYAKSIPASERYARKAPGISTIARQSNINRQHVEDLATGKAILIENSRAHYLLSRALSEMNLTVQI